MRRGISSVTYSGARDSVQNNETLFPILHHACRNRNDPHKHLHIIPGNLPLDKHPAVMDWVSRRGRPSLTRNTL